MAQRGAIGYKRSEAAMGIAHDKSALLASAFNDCT
jgi:hypothetical protein